MTDPRATDVARLIDQLERAIDGDAWHGDPVMAILERVIAALMAAHLALVADLRGVADSRLFEPINDSRHASGRGVTRYVLLHGLAQHHAYHAGQIAILAKF